MPAIQRSTVWKNSQVINYWDSLLRGYPAGLMMVHRRRRDETKGVNAASGAGLRISDRDYFLFDGQQRLTSILLGHGKGQLQRRLRLWVDLGKEPAPGSDLQFALRISSTGQPVGYQEAYPDWKLSLEIRRKVIEKWVENEGRANEGSSRVSFWHDGRYLAESVKPLPLEECVATVAATGEQGLIGLFLKRYPDGAGCSDRVWEFAKALAGVLEERMVFQLLGEKVIRDEHDYVRFFTRVGQGGTALTDDELTYSLIKRQYPEVRDRMQKVITSVGRVAGEVDLVLASLRIVKLETPWPEAKEWERTGRPGPWLVSEMASKYPEVERSFKATVIEGDPPRLQILLERLRKRLEFSEEGNPRGLPGVLLARLPKQLIDVLLLMEASWTGDGDDQAGHDDMAAFALYWMLFVSNQDQAARHIFRERIREQPSSGWPPLCEVVRALETKEWTWSLPTTAQLRRERERILAGGHVLRGVGSQDGERFPELGSNARQAAGTLRHFTEHSGHSGPVRTALMWLQRSYLTSLDGRFDPTTDRDEDLPVDLDHLIPHDNFKFHWKASRISPLGEAAGNFWRFRDKVGNSLGNYRWLDASENRSKGNRGVVAFPQCGVDPAEDEMEAWEGLVRATKDRWSLDDVALFQRLVDLRSLDLYERLVSESGIDRFASGDVIEALPDL